MAAVVISVTEPAYGDAAIILAFEAIRRAGVLVAYFGDFITVVETVIVTIASPPLLYTPPVLAGKLAGLAQRWRDV